jgi:YHS domain-containing protein
MRSAARICRPGTLLILLSVTALGVPLAAAPETLTAEARREAQDALSDFNGLIGEWRGVGQPRRGSNQGAWRQNAEWVWDFEPDSVGIKYVVKDGKLVSTARITWDAQAEEYVLTLTTPEKQQRTYRGGSDGEQRIVLTSGPDDDGVTHRITITRLNDKRTLVLHEKQSAGQQSFFRVAEVGYTREGTRLANPGGSGPECIVTGGAGTMQVTHKGKTYYVCCTGCRQAFEADPEGIIAEAAERKKQEALK